MKLSLLTPPTESPRDVPHVPIPQGWPGERQIAISTEGLPRQLAQAPMNPVMASAPWEALARFGATGGAVGVDVLNTVLHAQALRQEAVDLGMVDQIYTDTVNQFETDFEKHKITSNVETFRPGYDALWTEASQRAMSQATNPEVAKHLAKKLRGFSITKNAEAAVVDRQKLVDFQGVAFSTAIQRETALATEAPTEAARDYHLAEIDATTQRYARAGAIPLAQLTSARTTALEHIAEDRAKNLAHADPVAMLKRIQAGEPFSLPTKNLRELSDYTINLVRQQRSDLEHLQGEERRIVKEQQDETAMKWRVRISENYGPGRPNLPLLGSVNESARDLGEKNHAEIQTMERQYRENAAKAAGGDKFDTHIAGDIEYSYRTGNLSKYTAADLSRLLDSGSLDWTRYTHLSALRESELADAKATAKSAQTESQKTRTEQIRQGKATIEDLLIRGNRIEGRPDATMSKIIANDAITEFDAILAANPNANVDDVVTDVVVKRFDRSEKLGKSVLPYQTQEDVDAAYLAKQITKAQATRYTRLLGTRPKPKPVQTEVPTETPGLMDKIRKFFAPAEESPYRAPKP